ncbi:hypothetical protein [Fluviicola sp.]|uniref:hypothetical protein n=1 Tax=Fluviicola sp. TaxID=1917219 RepID=UPI003D28D087
MGGQYEADKIIQLLQFCSWKAHTSMSHSGLIELASKLGELPGEKEKYPNEKYLVDLLSDAKSAIKQDNIIRKRKSYIDLLLNYSGYNSWKDWKSKFYISNEYIHSKDFESTPIHQMKIAIWVPESLGKQLRALLIQLQKTSSLSLEHFFYRDEIEENDIKQELIQFNEYHFIIWVTSTSWTERMKSSTLQELSKSKGVIPVWIDPIDVWETDPPFINYLKQKEIIGGIPGIICSLLQIDELFKTDPNLNHSDAENSNPVTPSTQHFHDNSSGFINQGNISNQNNTVQTITNYHTKN